MRLRRALTVCVVALLPLLAFSNDSLWIDEANSALKAMQPSLTSWWHVLVSEKGSDLQMPFYMFYLWAWEKMAGHSELALRLANVPWLALAHYSLYRLCRRSGYDPLPLLALAGLNPFLWFYLNEARPYVMQYAGACMVVCALGEMARASRGNITSSHIWFLLGLLILASSSLLGVVWAASAVVAFVFLSFHCRRQLRGIDLFPFFVALILLAALAAFYLWTLSKDSRGSEAGKMGINNVLYSIFELFGFAGLGPGRLQIREFGLAAFRDYLFPICVLAGVLGVALISSARTLSALAHRSLLVTGLLYGLSAAIALLAFGFLAHFQLLARHFTPVTPLTLIVLAAGLTQLFTTRWKLAGVALCLLWLGSSLALRFAPRHRKDDYRSAAAAAKHAIAEDKTVWWSADRAAAKYYGLPVEQGNQFLALVINPHEPDLAKLPRPDLIILSKPDLYDENGALLAYLATERFADARALPAITVWRR
jgi:hypothetical protein